MVYFLERGTNTSLPWTDLRANDRSQLRLIGNDDVVLPMIVRTLYSPATTASAVMKPEQSEERDQAR